MSSARNNRKRRRNRGRFGLLFKLLCAVALVVAITVGATVFFQVETVVVTGNSRYSQEEVVAASGIQVGDNLFRMNKYQVAKQIRTQLPYVEELSISRGWPSTILIQIQEWDAVAQVMPTQAQGEGQPQAEPQQPGEDGTDGATDSAAGSAAEEEQQQAALRPWLISVGGKLLEEAPEDSTAIRISGLTALSPQAGTPLAVPVEQQFKLDALLQLLKAAQTEGVMDKLERIDLSQTSWLSLQYDGRFAVKIPLSGEMARHLKVLMKAVDTRESYETGSMDLTQKDYVVVYSPN